MEKEEDMDIQIQSNSPFATERIEKLILKFAVPAIIAMLVNSLYNIVDQIFIGRGVGFLGNTATNVAFPFVVISMSLGLMIGDGCAAAYSLNLGRGDIEAAKKSVGNALIMEIFAGIIFLLLGVFFAEPLLNAFGATSESFGYAKDYLEVIALGMPFFMISFVGNSIARADGSPKYSMIAMLTGAVINIVLDALFIFGFNWEVKGAAFATIIGQTATAVISLFYFKRFKNIKFDRSCLKLDREISGKVCALGISSFISQFSIAVVIVCMNNVLGKTGAQSIYGEDIPLAAQGIVMKVNQIMMAVLIGVSVGAQPIIGFNYGAGNIDRVKKTYKISIIIATIWACLGWIVFRFFNQPIISIFGQEDALYNQFAQMTFKVFLGVIFLNGFTLVSSVFFQAIGRPLKAAITSICRQIAFFIPTLFLLSKFFGVEGALYTGPVTDTLAFLLTLVFIIFEMRHLNKMRENKF